MLKARIHGRRPIQSWLEFRGAASRTSSSARAARDDSAGLFVKNFQQYEGGTGNEVRAAAPAV